MANQLSEIYLTYREALFPVQITGVDTSTGIPRYAWTEQSLDPTTGKLVPASSPRFGTVSQRGALELNNQGRTGFPFYAWLRLRGSALGDSIYDFIAPLGCLFGQLTSNLGCGKYTFQEVFPCPTPDGTSWNWLAVPNGVNSISVETNGIANIPLGTIVEICPTNSFNCNTTTTTTTTTTGSGTTTSTTAGPTTTTTTSTTTTIAPPCVTTTTTSTTTTTTTTTSTTTTGSGTTTTTTTTQAPPIAWAFTYCCGQESSCSPTTTTTTTINPCSTVPCTWTWSAATAKWVLTCTGCPYGTDTTCICQPPAFCGLMDGETTRTNCISKALNLSPPCCTSTTCGPTTTTTTTAGATTTVNPVNCQWFCDPVTGAFCNPCNCPPGCYCAPVGSCGSGAECTSIGGQCICGTTFGCTPSCGGQLTYVCDFFGDWQLVSGGCNGSCCSNGTSSCNYIPPTGKCSCGAIAKVNCQCIPFTTGSTTTCNPVTCAVGFKSDYSAYIVQDCNNAPCRCTMCATKYLTNGQTTLCPCAGPASTTTTLNPCCGTTTCNPQGTACCGLCRWRGNGSGGWTFVDSTCNPAFTCGCSMPPYVSVSSSEEASTLCGQATTTTTTTSTTTTTTTTTTQSPCVNGSCMWQCQVIGNNGCINTWIQIQDGCTAKGGGCACQNPNNANQPCNFFHNGQVITTPSCGGAGTGTCNTTTACATTAAPTTTTTTTTSTTTTLAPCVVTTPQCAFVWNGVGWASTPPNCTFPCTCNNCTSGSGTMGQTTLCPCVPPG